MMERERDVCYCYFDKMILKIAIIGMIMIMMRSRI